MSGWNPSAVKGGVCRSMCASTTDQGDKAACGRLGSSKREAGGRQDGVVVKDLGS